MLNEKSITKNSDNIVNSVGVLQLVFSFYTISFNPYKPPW